MNEENITAIIAKANVLRADYTMLSIKFCKDLAKQLEKKHPGCIKYDEETQEVIYNGPAASLQ